MRLNIHARKNASDRIVPNKSFCIKIKNTQKKFQSKEIRQILLPWGLVYLSIGWI